MHKSVRGIAHKESLIAPLSRNSRSILWNMYKNGQTCMIMYYIVFVHHGLMVLDEIDEVDASHVDVLTFVSLEHDYHLVLKYLSVECFR